MLLDLFITHYKEPWEVCEKGFLMLKMQRMVDWSQIRITVVHDGTECFPEGTFDGYPCEIHEVSIPHGGIAAARNWCIDHSEAKWIRWHDCDDCFANIYALRDIMNVLSDNWNLMLWFDVVAETGDHTYIRDKRDPVVVHGKVFRRHFLLEHNIRFNEELTWCEDSAFLAVIEMEIDHNKIGKIKTASPIYAWIERQGSLCNRPEIRFKNLQSFFLRHTYVAEEFLKRGLIDQYNTMCVRVMADSFYTCRMAPVPEDRTEHEKKVWEWFDKHKEPFYACRPEMFKMVMEAVNRECNDGGVITAEEFIEWIRKHERGE